MIYIIIIHTIILWYSALSILLTNDFLLISNALGITLNILAFLHTLTL